LLEIFNDYVKDKDIQNSNRIGTDIWSIFSSQDNSSRSVD
jgi:hypothetical protein